MILPAFSSLSAHYPTGDASSVKRRIGGNVNLAWVVNTCTIRVCHALNLAGARIPSNVPGLSTIRGGNGMRYAYRVREFRRFLETRVRPPDVTDDVKGQRGIICFEISGWSDATGHFDLWDGSTCYGAPMADWQKYFKMANEVVLWRC